MLWVLIGIYHTQFSVAYCVRTSEQDVWCCDRETIRRLTFFTFIQNPKNMTFWLFTFFELLHTFSRTLLWDISQRSGAWNVADGLSLLLVLVHDHAHSWASPSCNITGHWQQTKVLSVTGRSRHGWTWRTQWLNSAWTDRNADPSPLWRSTTSNWRSCTAKMISVVLVVALVERWTRDRKVTGSTPGRGAIKSTRSTQPSIPQG